ncbi:cation-translocating P-type ATPase [Nocardioides bigeumensis]|uniref:Cation-translocating P-type ATPase n=1 Tax=Nocardioides bigeumensis TaxID=433657 RepID=A0ABP5JRV9_9ACTN
MSTAEAQRRLATSGANEVVRRRRLSVWSSIGAQLRDPLVLVLIAAFALTVITGDLSDAAVIALVVLANTTVGVAQELKADRAITALAQLTSASARALRDGTVTSVPSAELVADDVVLLGEGDIVPADCELLEATSLLVDESALTGESVAVAKFAPDGLHSADPHESADELASGSVVVKGRAVAVVRRTGAASGLGRIAELTDTRVQPTPLQRRLAELGRWLAIVAVAMCALVLVLGLLRGQPLEAMLVTAVSLAVAAVPESLPAVVTLSLALGARRMVARHALIRRLPAVETLGSVTVLATDKTGTLTQARMAVDALWTPGRGPVLLGEDGSIDLDQAPDVAELLRASALCNDASLVPPAGAGSPWSGLGDPTEVALLLVAAGAGLFRGDLEKTWPRVAEVPFDSADQQMTTTHRLGGESPEAMLVVSKGSVEALRARHGQGADRAAWAEAGARAETWAALGARVLAVTSAEVLNGRDWEQAEHRLLGLVSMRDPVKRAARDTLASCKAAGIHPILITGDHPATALAVATRVGLLTDVEAAATGSVATGPEISAGSVPDLTTVRVFARCTPEQKLDIVRAWQDRGAVVAMTGDGVNDGPALRSADIGVAMGHRGTEVARQAADLVLADDNLDTVVAAVEEGRRVYTNIRRFLLFAMAGGAAEILVMLLGPFVGLAVPLLAAQILWVNLLTHGLTGVALGAEPADPAQMRRPPRPPGHSVLGGGLWERVLALSAVLAVATLGLGVWAQGADRAWQSLVFVALTSLQLGVALGLRSSFLTRANPLLPAAVAGSLSLSVAGVYLPVLHTLLGTTTLPVADLAASLAVGVVGFVAARVARRTPAGRSETGRSR